MFGQNRPLFGGTTTTGFGGGTTFGANTSTGFGQSAFGAKPAGTAAPTFQGSTFGTGAPMFGSTQPATSQPSGSLFGAPAPAFGAQPAQGFGTATSTGTFGGFGAGTSGGGMFGSPAPSTGLFGAPQAAATATSPQGGLFGSSAATGFGAQKPAFGGFGGGTSTGGLFGQTQTQPAQTTSLFGQPATPAATGGSLFGSSFGSAPAAGPTGTAVKFNPPIGTDSMMKNNIQTNVSTRHQCITCMKEYETKSLEELRFEDYALGRKGPAAGTQQTGLFGATAATPAGGLFGSTATSPQKPLFGSTPTAGFGAGTTLFGQQQQQQQPAGGSLFGKPATTAATGFGFGQPQTQQPATGLFGQQQQPQQPFGATTSVFGAPATSQPSTGVFGAAAPSTGFAFGATSQPQQTNTGLFGAAKPAFGAPTTTSSFGFGQQTATSTAGGLFGAKPATAGFGTTPAFGTPATSAAAPTFGGFGSGTGLFGSTAPAAGTSAFGAKPAAPAFGFGTSTAPTSTGFSFGQTSGGSLFGSAPAAGTAAKPGGLFGSSAPFGTGTSFGSSLTSTGTSLGTLGAPAGTGLSFGTGISAPGTFGTSQTAPPAAASLPVHQYILTLAECSQSGDNPLFRKILESTGKREEVIKTSTAPSAPTPPDHKITPRPAAKLRIKPLLSGSASTGKKSLFEDLGQEDGPWESTEERDTSKDFFVPRRSVKKLQLTSLVANGSFVGGEDRSAQNTPNGTFTELPRNGEDNEAQQLTNGTGNAEFEDSISALNVRRPTAANTSIKERSSILDNTSGLGEAEITAYEEVVEQQKKTAEPEVPHPVGIKLTRVGYYTKPSLEQLADQGLDANGQCIVDSFIVGRENYGFIEFEGPLDVANLNLDEIVHFRHKEVTVYPDDTQKPPEGRGLNRRAEITLRRVWPVDKSTGEYIKDPERLAGIRFEERLERATHKKGARFVEYQPETGSWTFKVNHFSTYGLEEM